MDALPSPARIPTIADVARLANVSSMTVSRVMNDQPNVAPVTRARVRQAMEQLGYRPNVHARSLVSGKSRTIGVITFDTTLYGPGAALLGIERAARGHSYGVAIETLERLDRPALLSAVRSMADRLVEGVIVIAPHVSAAGALSQAPRNVPIVAVEAAHPGDVPLAAVDQVLGAKLATAHLLELGHRMVWHVAGPADWFESRQRIEGWRDALAEAGMRAPQPLRGDWTARSGYAAGVKLLADRGPVTAVFAANDQMALGVLHACHEHGLRVPHQVSVVGFDDIPDAEYFTPSLTTIRQDFDEMGRKGLELLVRMLGADRVRQDVVQQDAVQQDVVRQDAVQQDLVAAVAPTLIVRASTAPPAR